MGCSLSAEDELSEEISVGSSEGEDLLNLNDATADDLMKLPGIGRSRAETIVAYRQKHGPFRSVEELANVPGIGETLASKLAQEVEVYDDDDAQGGFCCDPCAYCPPGGYSCNPFACCTSGGQCCDPCAWCPTGGLRLRSQIWDQEEVLFFPDDKERTGLRRIVELLASAQRSLDVAVFAISHKDLVEALIDARRRGVKVRVMADDVQATSENSLVGTLKKQRIEVRLDSSYKYHMHHKFIVIDGSTVLSGSLNWTHAAVEKGNENLVISKNPALCEDFADEFQRLWKLFKHGAGGHPEGPHEEARAANFRYKVAALFFPEVTGRYNAQLIAAQLQNARESIEVAVFTLTLDSLVDVLIQKHKEGLRVRVITDNRQEGVRGGDAERLRQAGVEVRVDRSWYAMHHKFAVIDRKTLINGSFNWTAQATKGNQEDCVVFRAHPRLANAFTDEFNRMWKNFQPR